MTAEEDWLSQFSMSTLGESTHWRKGADSHDIFGSHEDYLPSRGPGGGGVRTMRQNKALGRMHEENSEEENKQKGRYLTFEH